MIKNRLAIVLLIAWIPMCMNLIPFPSSQVVQKSHDAFQRLPDVLWKDMDNENEYIENLKNESIKNFNDWMPTYSELKSYYQFRWGYDLITVLCGVLGSILAIFGRKYWKALLFIAASLFLIYSYESIPRLLPTKFNIQVWYMIATNLDGGIRTLYNACIFPLIQIGVLAYLLFLYVRKIFTNNDSVVTQ